MKKIAVICELNPPHSGHERLTAEVREKHSECAVIAVMSGNFVQRGEPAVYPKHVRAAVALDTGFDLVIELPSALALSSAEGFARAGVALAATAGADTLAFGAECGDLAALKAAADAPDSGSPIMRSPNNLLAVEYIRAAHGLNLDFLCVRREPGVSATAERGKIRESGDTDAMFPENLDVAVLSRLRRMTAEDFLKIRGGTDGVAERTAKFAGTAAGIAGLADAIKTKRHLHSRIRRFILAAALGITREMSVEPQYIRVLAANERGRAALREIEESAALPLITKPADAKGLLAFESDATDLYNLGYADAAKRAGGAEWKISPIIR
ncbi:MAG: nucleotidyltransferase family protein [Oscillospiraceae bacterium]|jgi:predicted nucleotidyltransferase|nr:nucleotidyltransferase family protein [Oscillospiraceae bacterium]